MSPTSLKARERLAQLSEQLSAEHVDFLEAPKHEISLAGKACLVTGGASGLGKAFTEALCSRGAYVAFLDTDTNSGAALQHEMQQNGHSVVFIEADVTCWDSQVAALEVALQGSPRGRIDHFIANAGVSGHTLSESMFPKRQKEVHLKSAPVPRLSAINISLIGSYYTMCLACHHFTNSPAWKNEAQADKSLILLGSMSSYRSIPFGTDYAAAKMGIRGLFTSARETMKLYRSKIRINMLSPQFIETAMNTHDRQWYERGGYRFCDINDAVRVLLRLVENDTIRGRSISINAEGPHDMDDDVGGGDGWVQVEKLLQSGLLPTWNF